MRERDAAAAARERRPNAARFVGKTPAGSRVLMMIEIERNRQAFAAAPLETPASVSSETNVCRRVYSVAGRRVASGGVARERRENRDRVVDSCLFELVRAAAWVPDRPPLAA